MELGWRNDILPELGSTVLVCYFDREGYHISIQSFKTVIQRDGELTGWYKESGFTAYPKPIPFWMPLPKHPMIISPEPKEQKLQSFIVQSTATDETCIHCLIGKDYGLKYCEIKQHDTSTVLHENACIGCLSYSPRLGANLKK